MNQTTKKTIFYFIAGVIGAICLGIIVASAYAGGEQLPQSTVENAVSMGASGMYIAISIATIQALIAGLKSFKRTSPFIKSYGRSFVLVLTAALSILTPVALGTGWTVSLLMFLANGSTPFIHDLVRARKQSRQENLNV